MRDIVKKQTITVAGLKGVLTPDGWIAPSRLTFEEWLDEFETLLVARRSVQFAIGDVLNFGEDVFGDEFSQALDITKMSPQRLATYKWVASAFPRGERWPELTWTHHKHVASIPAKLRRNVMEMAYENGWSANDTYFYVSAWRALEGYGMDVEEAEPWAAHALRVGWTVPTMKRHIQLAREKLIVEEDAEITANDEMREEEERPVSVLMPAGDKTLPAIEAGRKISLRLFFDVEITKRRPGADVIAFAFITPWGDKFYAENSRVDFSDIDDMARDEILPELIYGEREQAGRTVDPRTGQWNVIGDPVFVVTEFLQWLSYQAVGAELEIWADIPSFGWCAFLDFVGQSGMDYPWPDAPLDIATLLWASGRDPKMSRREWCDWGGRRNAAVLAMCVMDVWKHFSDV